VTIPYRTSLCDTSKRLSSRRVRLDERLQVEQEKRSYASLYSPSVLRVGRLAEPVILDFLNYHFTRSRLAAGAEGKEHSIWLPQEGARVCRLRNSDGQSTSSHVQHGTCCTGLPNRCSQRFYKHFADRGHFRLLARFAQVHPWSPTSPNARNLCKRQLLQVQR
jgi:hypothetical protein